MGNKVTGDKNVLMLGMEGAGKTHMLYTRLVGEAGMNTIKEKCSKDESERYP